MEKLVKKMLVSVEQTREKTAGLTRRIHVQCVNVGKLECAASSQIETIEWFEDEKSGEPPRWQSFLRKMCRADRITWNLAEPAFLEFRE